jgi:hypothetical protein
VLVSTNDGQMPSVAARDLVSPLKPAQPPRSCCVQLSADDLSALGRRRPSARRAGRTAFGRDLVIDRARRASDYCRSLLAAPHLPAGADTAECASPKASVVFTSRRSVVVIAICRSVASSFLQLNRDTATQRVKSLASQGD